MEANIVARFGSSITDDNSPEYMDALKCHASVIVKDAIKKGQEKYNGILRDLAKSIVTQAVKIGYEKYQTLIHEKAATMVSAIIAEAENGVYEVSQSYVSALLENARHKQLSVLQIEQVYYLLLEHLIGEMNLNIPMTDNQGKNQQSV